MLDALQGAGEEQERPVVGEYGQGTVGPRLRALRRRRETTLASLSAAIGILVSTLSRLESGDRKPTLELLLSLARAHGVTLDELVGASPTGDPRIHPRPVTRDGITMLPLTPGAGAIRHTS